MQPKPVRYLIRTVLGDTKWQEVEAAGPLNFQRVYAIRNAISKTFSTQSLTSLLRCCGNRLNSFHSIHSGLTSRRLTMPVPIIQLDESDLQALSDLRLDGWQLLEFLSMSVKSAKTVDAKRKYLSQAASDLVFLHKSFLAYDAKFANLYCTLSEKLAAAQVENENIAIDTQT